MGDGGKGDAGNNDDEDAAALEVLGRVKKRWERMSLSEARRSGSSTRMDRTNEAASFHQKKIAASVFLKSSLVHKTKAFLVQE